MDSTQKSSDESTEEETSDENSCSYDEEICKQSEHFSEVVGEFKSNGSSSELSNECEASGKRIQTKLGGKNEFGKGVKRHSSKGRNEDFAKRSRVSDDFLAVPGSSGVQHANTARGFHDDSGILIHQKQKKVNKKYGGEQIIFEATANPDGFASSDWGQLLINLIDTVRRLIEEIISRSTEGLSPGDLIRICVFAPGLDCPISTRLHKVEDMTVETLLGKICEVLQSQRELRLDEKITFDVVTIKRPTGRGRKPVLNIVIDRLGKRSVVSIPTDEGGLCCARAIVVGYAAATENPKYNSIRNGKWPLQKNLALELHENSGVPVGACGLNEIKKFEKFLDVQMHVISSEHFNKLIYKGVEKSLKLFLWHHDNHYDLIKSMPGFLGKQFYCSNCDKGYEHQREHHCIKRCKECHGEDCVGNSPRPCENCFRTFKSDDCFNRHLAVTGKKKFSICQQLFQCKDCCKIIERKRRSPDQHECGETKCVSCKEYVRMSNHLCFLEEKKPKKPSEKLIFFDFEAMQDTGEHIVNFAVVKYFGGEEVVFEGKDTIKKFCNFLFSPRHKKYTAIAHNLKGYDGQFILAHLLSQGIKPRVITNGSKIMSMEVSSHKIRLIDSLNFLPIPLSKFPKTFGLEELAKGYFPHLFNTEENQAYVGTLPEAKYYAPNFMNPSEREQFMRWYEETKAHPFNFRKELDEYCKSDVDILRRCCLQFRNEFMKINEVDPFSYITIASACMAVYRSKHIPEKKIPMVPVRGYTTNVNFSKDSIEWLKYLEHTMGVEISHALNGGGEKIIDGAHVDGYCEQTNTVFQFHGCFFHGCNVCFDRDLCNPVSKIPMWALLKKTKERAAKIQREGFDLQEIWEHDFRKMKQNDSSLRDFCSQLEIVERLNPRDAFYGGRTNATRLFYEGKAKYIDFTSLYPFVNKYCSYPVGHPEIITSNFGDISEYFGIIKCSIIPPRGLYHPVLPFRSLGKLTFPLCSTCVEARSSTCKHDDKARALKGTWVTIEVEKAIETGYKIDKIYEVHHFKDRTTSLFTTYINTFLKTKQEASGWPEKCQTPEERTAYIRNYEEHEGVSLNPNKIEKNPGRRQVSKLCLNSFWGRWGMKENKIQTSFVSSLPEFNAILTDSTKEVNDTYFPNESMAVLKWKMKEEFSPQSDQTNIYLATFTTAHARLKLYNEIEKLGDAVLYYDTDSIIYASNGSNDPKIGDFLGDFTDELEGDVIEKFVSGGPKNYAYVTKSGKSVCKIRGFSLNYENSLKLNFESVSKLVNSFDDEVITVQNPRKITIDVENSKVINRMEEKSYRKVYDKRVILHDLNTLPYGY